MERKLVTGGAGYIGSHMVKLLLNTGYKTLVLDNFSTGHKKAVLGGEIVEGDLADREGLARLFTQYRIDSVMHFASNIQVGESVADPGKYYRNNVANTLNLLDAMRGVGVDTLIFSSSAAIYGEPKYLPLDEAHPKSPFSPYGKSKFMVEQILADYDHAYDLKFISFRYFNAAGADPEGELGEEHNPETHLIPLILQVAHGQRDHLTILGRDYDTPDGTCIRDYVHVNDLCEAHLLGLKKLSAGAKSCGYNLGNGEGYSVQQVIDAARDVTGRKIAILEGQRRHGDPARLVADASFAYGSLGWQPRYSALEKIIEHAWLWQSRKT